jgi:hypothetical protein
MAATSDLKSTDKGRAAIFAPIGIVLQWITLGGLLVDEAVRAVAAHLLHPPSGAAVVAAPSEPARRSPERRQRPTSWVPRS